MGGWLDALEDAYLDGALSAYTSARALLDVSAALGRDGARLLERWPDARSETAMDELAQAVLTVAAAANRGGTPRASDPIGRFVLSEPARIERALRGPVERWGKGRVPMIADAIEMLAFPPFA